MKRGKNVGGYFLPIAEDKLQFESANALKQSALMIFFVLFGCLVFAETVEILKGYPSLYHRFVESEERAQFLFYLLPFIPLVAWFFLPPNQVILNRMQKVVHFNQGKRQFDFPWEQISFKHQWIPTKTGGSTLFTLIALPPYPEELNRLIGKKARPAPGQTFTFQLGSFDVEGPEHGQAIFAFLDSWMRSREPAKNLYEAMVRSRFRN